jgi:hypothetical protein
MSAPWVEAIPVSGLFPVYKFCEKRLFSFEKFHSKYEAGIIKFLHELR